MGRISLLLPNLHGGGAERVSLDLAHEFKRRGHSIEFVLMQAQGELLAEAQSAFSVVDLNCSRVRELPCALLHYLYKSRPDALLAAMWPLTAIAPLMRLAGYAGRVVVSEHGILSAQYRPRGSFHRAALSISMAIGYRLAHARAGVSVGVANDIASLSGLTRSRFEVINNPIPPRPAPNDEILQEVDAFWGIPHGARIVSVGSFKPVKNHSLLLRSFAAMARPDTRLMLVGTGEGEADLRALAVNLGVTSQIIFAGFHADPTPFYRTADLFVLSSDYEGFGNVVVEALACGIPVVSTDCPSGPAEILAHGRYGRLVPVRDAEALADAMRQGLAEPHDPRALKRRADDFVPAIAANRYLELLFP